MDINLKNIFIIAIAILVLFSTALAVSADLNLEKDGIQGHITDSHLEVDKNGNFNGYIKIDYNGENNGTDIKTLSDSDLKSLNESVKNKEIRGDLTVKAGEYVTINSAKITSATLENGVLTIEFNGTDNETKLSEYSGTINSMDAYGEDSSHKTFHIDGFGDNDVSSSSNSADDKSADDMLEESGWKKSSDSASAEKTDDGKVRVTSGSYVFTG